DVARRDKGWASKAPLAGRGCDRCSQLGEQVGHLEGAPDGLGALLDPRFGLLHRLAREDTEGHGDSGLERSELQTARGLPGDEVEVRRLAADHASESDDAAVAAGLRE